MRLLVSCVDNGSIKELLCNVGTDTSVQTALQPFHVAPHLAEGLKSHINKIWMISKDEVILARNSGVVELVKISKHAKENEVAETAVKEESKGVMDPLPKFDISEFEIVSSLSNLLNDLKLEQLSKKSVKRTKLVDEFVTLCPLKNEPLNSTFVAATKSGSLHIIKKEKDGKLNKLASLELKAPLEFLQLYDLEEAHDDKILFAYGGEENLVKLVEMESDFTSLEQVWEAKNVKNDRLDMRVPVWPMALKFLKPSPNQTDKDKLNYQFSAISRWSHLIKYSTQHGRKPFAQIDLLPNRDPLSQMEVFDTHGKNVVSSLGNLQSGSFDELNVITTDLKRNVFKFDGKGKMLSKIGRDDITGTSTYVHVHGGKYLLQGGLDRYVRVFDIKTNKMLVKAYLGSRINAIIMLDDTEIEMPLSASAKAAKEKQKRKIAEIEDDADDLWTKLEGKSGVSKASKKGKT
ncbi:ribosome biosynthesis protein NSA1 [Saccharomyces eubayanus]|uniref:ribosome biosynthesis protein NSA1 n=1 Tax=Saccharomyces eubayanus TaxID=1080349 RepID=UPI0006C1A8A0|nr:NSA1-like protein [Saccharomyces eubayanus]KOG99410.1 NSA1-like protein [Saccharomyces eubayanus]